MGWIMASGWARDGVVQDQIDASLSDAILRVRNQLPKGEGQSHCDECGVEIPVARRLVIPGTRYCVECQSRNDGSTEFSGYNRRASKDSQLR